MILENQILEPVFILPTKGDSDELLIVFSLDNQYGVTSLKIKKDQKGDVENGRPFWGYKLKVFRENPVAEISPAVSIRSGRLLTKRIWRPVCHVCDYEQRKLILDWVIGLNKTHAKLKGRHYG